MLTKVEAIVVLALLWVWADSTYGFAGWALVGAIGIVGWRLLFRPVERQGPAAGRPAASLADRP